MVGMKIRAAIMLLAFLLAISWPSLVNAEVESINVSPSSPVIGQPIAFFGMVSKSSFNDQLGVFVYPGLNCPLNDAIASTYLLANNATYTLANTTFAIYNVTLMFPVASSSSWRVQPGFTIELPVGSYSVGVQDVTSGANLCKNFTVTSQPVPEFSGGQAIVIFMVLLVALHLTGRRRHVPRKGYDFHPV